MAFTEVQAARPGSLCGRESRCACSALASACWERGLGVGGAGLPAWRQPCPALGFATWSQAIREHRLGLPATLRCLCRGGPGAHPASLVSAAQYFASTMIIVGLSVVVTVIVLQYHHHDPDGGKMPKWVRSSCPSPRGVGGPCQG